MKQVRALMRRMDRCGSAKLRSRIGISLAEVLIAIAISVAVLGGAVAAGAAVMRNAHQATLDAEAKAMYLAAQRHLTQLRSSGDGSDLSGSGTLSFDVDGTAYIFNYVGSRSGNTDTVFPSGIVSQETYENDWIIVYDMDNTLVIGAYYFETYDGDIYAAITGGSDAYTDRSTRHGKVGYYGVSPTEYVAGALPSTVTDTDRASYLFSGVTNGETLTASFLCDVPTDVGSVSDTVIFRYTVSDGENTVSAEETVTSGELMQEDGTAFYRFSAEITLDSLESGKGFKDRYAELTAGKNLKIALTGATLSGDAVTPSSIYPVSGTTNSLFAARGTRGDDAVVSVANRRHLQNLNSYADTDSIYVLQTKDIDLQGETFTPITQSRVTTYDGGNHTIANLSVSAARAGLFGTFSGSAIKNTGIIVTDAASLGDAAAITGTDFAGGIAGYAAGDLTITNSYAATVVAASGGTAGGLVGWVSGTLTVTGSYADCYLSGAAVGGLAGTCGSGSSFDTCYAAGYVTGSATTSAGFAPCGNAVIKNSYSAVADVDTGLTTSAATAANAYYVYGGGDAGEKMPLDVLVWDVDGKDGAGNAYDASDVKLTGFVSNSDGAYGFTTGEGSASPMLKLSTLPHHGDWSYPTYWAAVYRSGSNYRLVLGADTSAPAGYTLVERYSGDFLRDASVPWSAYSGSVTSVTFDPSFAYAHPVSTANWFAGMTSITTVTGTANLDTTNITSMAGMFQSCTNLTSLDVSGFDTSKVTSMANMFQNCGSLTALAVGGFDTSKVTDMSGMFQNCAGLSAVDVSGFNTSNVMTMAGMFQNCSGLSSIAVGGFDTSKIEDFSSMFSGCTRLSALAVSGFSTARATDLSGMFQNCSGLTELELNHFATAGVTRMADMFRGCSSLITIYALDAFVTTAVTDGGSDMFLGCEALYGGAGTAYDSAHVGADYAKIDGGVSSPGYLTRYNKVFVSFSGNTLYFRTYQTAGSTEIDLNHVYQTEAELPWYSNKKNISVVNIEAEITPVSTAYWFKDCTRLTRINLQNIDPMILRDTTSMFEGCTALTTISVSPDCDMSGVTSGANMFLNCTKLVGGNGTTYSADHVDQSYAVIDAPPASPGYFDCQIYVSYLVEDGVPTLLFSYNVPDGATALASGFTGTAAYAAAGAPWSGYRDTIQKVRFESKVSPTNMRYWFNECTALTTFEGLENLDTSKVTSMAYLFYGCTSLTELDLRSFDTSSVTSMAYMFYGCTALTSVDLSSFNTSSVTSMADMFYNCGQLQELDLKNFNTSSVTTMTYMFYNCKALTLLDVSSFNTSKVTSMTYMFQSCNNVTELDVSGFDTTNVTSFYDMFASCYNVEELDVSNFNTSKVTSMYGMFSNCRSVKTLDLSGFDTSKVTSMYAVFQNCYELTEVKLRGDNGPLDTSRVTTMQRMFYECRSLQSVDLSGFDTSRVSLMQHMFYGCTSLTSVDLSGLDTSNVSTMESMFSGCAALTSADLTGVDTIGVRSMASMFYNCGSLPSLDLSSFNTSNITTMASMFYGCTSLTSLDVSGFNTSNVTAMSYMFYNCRSLPTLDVSGFDTSNVTTMAHMFRLCSLLTAIDVSGFNTSNVTSMAYMFSGCSALKTIDVGSFDTSHVTSMNYMFNSCGSLTTIYSVNDFVLASGLTSTNMFKDCTSLEGGSGTKYASSRINATYARIDGGTSRRGYFTYSVKAVYDSGDRSLSFVSSYTPSATIREYTAFDLSAAYDAETPAPWTADAADIETVVFQTAVVPSSTAYWFYGLSGVTAFEGLERLSTEGVADMSHMFENCAAVTELDVSSFDTTSLTDTSYMFSGCAALETVNMNGWDASAVTDASHMFAGCAALRRIDSAASFTDAASGADMFSGCVSLVGGAGSEYDPGRTTNAYAHVDGGEDNPGYFTSIVYAMYGTGTLTFMDTEPEGKTLDEDYWIISGGDSFVVETETVDSAEVITYDTVPWGAYRADITTVVFSAPVSPSSTAYWFYGFKSVVAFTGLSNLDTSNVTDMSHMFQGCSSSGFTRIDLSGFDTSNVTDMSHMFRGCTYLATFIFGEDFDTSNVTDMSYMFRQVQRATQLNISGFDTSSVTNMSYMFYQLGYSVSTPSNFKGIVFGEKWDTSHVTDMSYMFYYMRYLGEGDIDLSRFDTSSVTNMSYMFYNCGYLYGTQADRLITLDVSCLDTSSATNMSYMFQGMRYLEALEFGGDFDTSNVTTMAYMFSGCSRLASLDLSTFDTSNVTTMAAMFNACSLLASVDVSGFDTAKVTSMNSMFLNCGSLTVLDLRSFTRPITTLTSMFSGCTKLATIYATDAFNVTALTAARSASMFANCEQLVGGNGTAYSAHYDEANSVGINGRSYGRVDKNGQSGYFTNNIYAGYDGGTLTFRTTIPESGSAMFVLPDDDFVSSDAPRWGSIRGRVSKVVFAEKIAPVSTAYWFYGFFNLTSIEGIENLDTSNVTNMAHMFESCGILTALDLTDFDTSNVTNMSYMFSGCGALARIDASASFDTTRVTGSESMFAGCENLPNYNGDEVDKTHATTDDGGYFSIRGVENGLSVDGLEPELLPDELELESTAAAAGEASLEAELEAVVETNVDEGSGEAESSAETEAENDAEDAGEAEAENSNENEVESSDETEAEGAAETVSAIDVEGESEGGVGS